MARAKNAAIIKGLRQVTPALVCAVVVLALNLPRITNPSFFGDGGRRLDNAGLIIVADPYRAWLPLLQLHIHLLWSLKVPLFLYPFIPFAYLCLFLVGANLLGVHLLGRAARGYLCFLFLLLFCLNPLVSSFSFTLYQEIPALGLLALLLWLWLQHRRRHVLIAGVMTAGMLTRESFWPAALLLTLLAWTRLIRSGGRDRQALWLVVPMSVPPLWSTLVGHPMLPGIDHSEVSWQADIVWQRLKEIVEIGAKQHLLLLLATALGGGIAAALFEFRARRFSGANMIAVVSLFVVLAGYAHVLIVDPFNSGNPRVLLPALLNVPFLYLFILSVISRAARPVRRLVVLMLLAALLTSIRSVPPLFQPRAAWENAFYREVEKLPPHFRSRSPAVEAPLVCIVRPDYWNEYIPWYVAPLLYTPRTILPDPADARFCHIVIAPEKLSIPGFTFHTTLASPDGHTRGVWFQEPKD